MADWRNKLYYGDCLAVLRKYIPDEFALIGGAPGIQDWTARRAWDEPK